MILFGVSFGRSTHQLVKTDSLVHWLKLFEPAQGVLLWLRILRVGLWSGATIAMLGLAFLILRVPISVNHVFVLILIFLLTYFLSQRSFSRDSFKNKNYKNKKLPAKISERDVLLWKVFYFAKESPLFVSLLGIVGAGLLVGVFLQKYVHNFYGGCFVFLLSGFLLACSCVRMLANALNFPLFEWSTSVTHHQIIFRYSVILSVVSMTFSLMIFLLATVGMIPVEKLLVDAFCFFTAPVMAPGLFFILDPRKPWMTELVIFLATFLIGTFVIISPFAFAVVIIFLISGLNYQQNRYYRVYL